MLQEPLSRGKVGLNLLDTIIRNNPGYISNRIPKFNGFTQVLLEDPQKILGHVSESDGVKGSVLMEAWEYPCPNKVIRAMIAKPFLEALLNGYNNGDDTADISPVLMQYITTPDGNYALTEQGIWNIISPWFRWDSDQSRSEGVLRLNFSDYPLHKLLAPPIYPVGTRY